MNNGAIRVAYYGPISNVHLTKWANSMHGLNGYSITIFYDTNDSLQMQKIDDRIKVVYLPDIVGGYKKNKLSQVLYYLRVRKLLKSLNFDIIHLHFMERKMMFLSNLKNVVMSIWGMDLIYDGNNESMISKIMKKYMIKTSKEVIVSSDFMRNYITSNLNLANKKVNVIKLGVDINKFAPSKQKESGVFTLLFAKHFYKKYGPEILLKAFEKIHYMGYNIKLTMLGNGPLLDECKNKYSLLINAGVLSFIGKVDHNSVINFLNDSDVFVMPSIYDSETLGVAAIEAISMNKIVIASNVGGVPEVVIDRQTGLLIKRNDVDDLIEKIIDVYEHIEQYRLMASNGHKFVSKYFNWDNCVNQLDLIYESIVREGGIACGKE